MKPKVYRKHQSFVGFRHHVTAPDPRQRLEAVLEGLDAGALPPQRQTVVRQACEALLGSGGDSGFSLHLNTVDELARLSDSELPRYLYYRYRYEVYPQRHELDEFPPCLQIEPSSICNYRCTFCYQADPQFSHKSSGQMGLMTLDVFRRVVDQAEGACEAVTLASRGEPLIHKQIGEMLAYLRDKFLALKLNTNAWYLDERACHALLEAGVNTVVFSADSIAEPLYSQLRVNGKLERVLENISRFRDIRQRHYPHSRTIARVSGVQVPGTASLAEMEAFWGEYVDQVALVAYNPWESLYEQPINQIETPCSDLWRRMFVWWDGNVNPCDTDYRSTLKMGNVQDSTLAELWRSPAYEQLRADHLERRRGSRAPCQRCVVV